MRWLRVVIRVIVVEIVSFRVFSMAHHLLVRPLVMVTVVRRLGVSVDRVGINMPVAVLVGVRVNVVRVVGIGTTIGANIIRMVLRLKSMIHLLVVHVLNVAVVLLSSNVVVLVALLGLLAHSHGVLWSGLCHNWLNLSGLEAMSTMEVLKVIWLHLQHKVALVNVGLAGTESSAIGIKSGVVRLVPPVSVEGREVIPPVEVETFRLEIVSVGLNVVVHDVPRHILRVEALAPRLKSGRPEVHHDRLGLAGELYGGIVLGDPTHLFVVDRPRDKIGGPCHLIDVPVAFGVEAGAIIVSFVLCVSITIDNIHREGVLLD